MTPLALDAAALLADYDAALLRTAAQRDAALRELAIARLMFRAAMDALALVATQPERYEQMQRQLLAERKRFMAKELARVNAKAS